MFNRLLNQTLSFRCNLLRTPIRPTTVWHPACFSMHRVRVFQLEHLRRFWKRWSTSQSKQPRRRFSTVRYPPVNRQRRSTGTGTTRRSTQERDSSCRTPATWQRYESMIRPSPIAELIDVRPSTNWEELTRSARSSLIVSCLTLLFYNSNFVITFLVLSLSISKPASNAADDWQTQFAQCKNCITFTLHSLNKWW